MGIRRRAVHALIAAACAVAFLGCAQAAAAVTVEAHWDTVATGGYHRAGDYTSDFSPADANNGVWQLVPTSGPPEIGFIKLLSTGSGHVEVHLDALSGGSYQRVGDYATDFSPADAQNGVWQLFGSSGGAPELGFIKLRNAGSGTVEVHVDALSGGSYHRILSTTSDFSPADASNGTWQLIATSSGPPELGFIKELNTGSGRVEVHLDAFTSGSYKRTGDYVSDFSPADAGNGVWQLLPTTGAPELGFVKFKNTGSGTVEVHLDTLGSGGYTRILSTTSDFSPADAANGWFALFGTAGSTPQLGFVKTWPALAAAKPATPPVQPVVTKQVLPVPAAPARRHGRHRHRRHIRAKFTIGWTWNHAHTRLVSVYVTGLPRNGTITIRCQGRGCAVTAMAARRRKVGAMLHSLEGRVFRAGDTVTITVSAPRRAPERIALRIRNGREPAARLL